jgi:hypothetical protein
MKHVISMSWWTNAIHKCSMHVKIYLSQNNPSKRNPNLEMKTSLKVLNIICLAQESTSVGHRHYKEVELDGWFLILHVVLETRTIWFMHKFNMSFVFHFHILGLTFWIWTNPSTERLKFDNPSKWNSYESFNLECRITYIEGSDGRFHSWSTMETTAP